MTWRKSLIAALAAASLLASLQGCRTNPATGRTTFTGGMSTAEEVSIGRKAHPQVLKEFGGEYGSPALRKYVDSIGQLLARTTERRDLTYRFTVLNSDIINAFATPGGYIYISRGLLALADNEAQLAGVLAHELGHITALHHARRYGKGIFAQILVGGAAILTGTVAPELSESIMQVGQVGAVALLRSYSRANEFESDDLGVRYLSRAGYDPGAMAGFLRKLRAHSRLEARMSGQSADKVDQFSYLATHPAPIERVRRAEAKAQAARVARPMTARQIYLGKIDGILYGDDPEQGFVRGRVFLHPVQRFRFEVPKDFRLLNSTAAVLGLGPGGARIVFDQDTKPGSRSMRAYLQNEWGKKLRLSGLEGITVNGLEAATATTSARGDQGIIDARLVAIRTGANSVYRFLFVTPRRVTQQLAVPLRRTTYSFRRLTEREASAIKALHLKVYRVRPGDTQSSVARRMAFDDFKLERFQVLNGLQPGEGLRAGQLVKIVTE